jgi:hypothetical protein
VFRQAVSSDFVSGGVLGIGELAVGAQASPNMTIQVGAGRAMIAGTQVSAPTLLGGATATYTTQAMYEVLNDAAVTLTIATSNPTNPRIDAVYAGVQDAFYSGATNTAVLGVVTGTPAPSPVAPAIPNNATLLGYVAVAANASSIVSGNITQASSLATVFGGGYTSAAFTPTGIYTAGSPAPQVMQLGSRIFAEGMIASSSASFVTGNTYTAGSIPSAWAPSVNRVFACLTNISATAWVQILNTGTITFAVGVNFSGLLNLTLEGCSWRPKGY